MTDKEKKRNIREKFEKYVVRKEGCWDWKGCIHHKGYAPMNFYDNKQKNAHIVSWILHRGKIPDGLFVLHKCDNRKCTNPDHLYLGTQRDNVRDREERSLSIKGEKNPKAKLSTQDIPKIIQGLKEGFSQSKIARYFGVTQTTISRIKTGIGWV